MESAPSRSGVARLPSGVPGLDTITGGGLPRGRVTLVAGGPGTGKTILALHALVAAARRREQGHLVSFEESPDRIIANSSGFGWDLRRLRRAGYLSLTDGRLSPDAVRNGDFELSGLLASVGAQARKRGARLMVLDGLDVLLSLLPDPAARRREIHRIQAWLEEGGLTGLVTAKAGLDGGLGEYEFLEFMLDCVVRLRLKTTHHVATRSLRVTKFRGSGFSANEAPVVIGPRGMEIAAVGPEELSYSVSSRRVSSGVPRLDRMLGGGYHRGSSVLFSGSPGTAKTTLACAFIDAACRRGERGLYVSFDEPGQQVVRNLRSVGVDLRPHVAEGRLRFLSARTEQASADAFLVRIEALIREHRPAAMVIDPFSALAKSGGEEASQMVSTRLVDLAKSRGITLVSTSLVDGSGEVESTPVAISTIIDTWMHLSYIGRGGERNRTLSIIKARGTGHSNQVRELVLGRAGLDLADVYTAGGEVLLGTLRWERERADEEAAAQGRLEQERRGLELRAAEADAVARAAAVERELAAIRGRVAALDALEAGRDGRQRSRLASVERLRSGDRPRDGAARAARRTRELR